MPMMLKMAKMASMFRFAVYWLKCLILQCRSPVDIGSCKNVLQITMDPETSNDTIISSTSISFLSLRMSK